MRFKRVVIVISLLLLSGCSSWFSSDSVYKPVRSFYIKSVHLHLDKGEGAAPSQRFSSQETLEKDFTYSIQKYLVEHDIYAVTPDKYSAALVVHIEYKRRYKYGGKALNRPLISHQVQVYQHGRLIETLSRSNYSPINGLVSGVVINLMQAVHLWNRNNEHTDADTISASIVDDLAHKFEL